MPTHRAQITSATGNNVLARSIALPEDTQSLRFPNYPSLDKTATIDFNPTTTYSVEIYDNIVKPISSFLMMRQAVYPVWAIKPINAIADCYRYHMVLPGAQLSKSTDIGALQEATTGDVAKATGAAARDNGYAMVGIHGMNSYMFVPYGAWVTAYLVASGAITANITIDYEVIVDGAVDSRQTFSASGSVTAQADWIIGTSNTSTGVWMRPTRITSDTDFALNDIYWVTSGTNLSHVASSVPSVNSTTWAYWQPLASPQMNIDIPYSDTRVTALSLLGTNTTKVLDKEGTIQSARFNPRVRPIWSLMTGDVFTSIHPTEKYFAALEKGFYTYLPPTEGFLEFQTYIRKATYQGTTVNIPAVNLENYGLAHYVRTTDTTGGTSLAVNIHLHTEFRTATVYWPLGVSPYSNDMLQTAQRVINNAGFFFDNTEHALVLRALSTAATKPAVRSAVGMAGRALGGIARMGVNRLAQQFAQKALVTPQRSMALPAPIQTQRPRRRPRVRVRAIVGRRAVPQTGRAARRRRNRQRRRARVIEYVD